MGDLGLMIREKGEKENKRKKRNWEKGKKEKQPDSKLVPVGGYLASLSIFPPSLKFGITSIMEYYLSPLTF
jgi:hypothetical protein